MSSSSHVHRSPISGLVSGYGREQHLGAYAMLFGTYATATAVGVVTGVRRRGRWRRRGLPRPSLADGALLAVAAFKLSR
ncbi:MAG TPA: hypothetical protein VLO10_00860, partial [Candidatus Deferrimicrobium sp.]|nr:hypothetical protein [Candidatus Deferrimicrobium sp.]